MTMCEIFFAMPSQCRKQGATKATGIRHVTCHGNVLFRTDVDPPCRPPGGRTHVQFTGEETPTMMSNIRKAALAATFLAGMAGFAYAQTSSTLGAGGSTTGSGSSGTTLGTGGSS